RGIGEHREMLVVCVVHMHSMVDALLRCVEQAHLPPAHHKLDRMRQTGEIVQARAPKLLLMPLHMGAVLHTKHNVVPVAFDRDLTGLATYIDRLGRMWALAHEIAQTKDACDIPPTNIVERGL